MLKDGSFGELLVGGRRPQDGRHVFGSVQSLARYNIADILPEAFDLVVVDEFHHAAAPTYARLLEHLRPRVLLGLTATPERHDAIDVTHWFDGRIDYELRLWQALDQGLLCPFQYFGVADDVPLDSLEWKAGGYDVRQLSTLYTGNDFRTTKIIQAVRQKVVDTAGMRALGFCVSVEHAQYMAARFNAADIPSVALTGKSTTEERNSGLRSLRERSSRGCRLVR